ncbi:MAG: MaoC/PaaZ C-terminal domain-containing protein [Smithella sp.]
MPLQFADLNIGDSLAPYTSSPITRTDLVRYAGASGDFNPLHHDNTFVTTIGMERVIVHGMLIMGIAGQAITSWIDNKDLRKFNVRFAGITEPVDFDDWENTWQRATITITGKIRNKFEENGENRIRCDIVAKDGLGNTKLRGFFIAALQ